MIKNVISNINQRFKKQSKKSVIFLDPSILITKRSQIYNNVMNLKSDNFDELSLKLIESLVKQYSPTIVIFSHILYEHNSFHKFITYLRNNNANILADHILSDTIFWRSQPLNSNNKKKFYMNYLDSLKKSRYIFENVLILDNHKHDVFNGYPNVKSIFISKLDGIGYNNYLEIKKELGSHNV